MRARVLGGALVLAFAVPVSTAAAKCPSTLDQTPVVSEAPPPAGLAARMGVLRRPQTPEDRATIEAFKHNPLRVLYAQSLRLLRSDPDGRSWYFYAGKAPRIRYSHACLRHMPADLRRTMLRIERDSIRRSRKVAYGVFEFNGGHSGGFFGGDLSALLHGGQAFASLGEDGETSVLSLVPDGVAWVDVTLGGGTRRVVGVTNNLWQVDVDQPVVVLPPRRMIWKAADGTVVGRFSH